MIFFEQARWGLLSLCFFLFACSSTNTEDSLVTEEKKVARDQAIVVLGVQWVEEYNDLKEMKQKAQFSQELLKNEKRIAARRAFIGKPALIKPLYHLANLKLNFQDGEGETQKLTRYNLDLREYETLAIHHLDPMEYELQQFRLDEYRFFQKTTKTDPIRWKKFIKQYPIPSKKWTLSPGKVFYLGHVTFFFKTERFLFGRFPQEQVVRNVELTRIRWENQFGKTQEALGKEKPWFPFAKMENLGLEEGDWSFENREWIPYSEKQEEKKEQVDLDKYFY